MVARSPVLYAIVTGAPSAAGIGTLVTAAQTDGWTVGVIATPSAAPFLDRRQLNELTGFPVVTEHRAPGGPEPLPPSDAVVVAPATANTIAKLATGIADTLATGRCAQAIGAGAPVLVAPFGTREHLTHPAIVAAIETLRSWGVRVLDGSEVASLPEKGPTATAADCVDWLRVWCAVREHSGRAAVVAPGSDPR